MLFKNKDPQDQLWHNYMLRWKMSTETTLVTLFSGTRSNMNSPQGNPNKRINYCSHTRRFPKDIAPQGCTQALCVQLFCSSSLLVSQGTGPMIFRLLQGLEAAHFLEDTKLVTNAQRCCNFVVAKVVWIPVLPLVQ